MSVENRAKWGGLIPDTGLKFLEAYDQGNDLYLPGIFNVLNKATGDVAQKNFTGKTGFGEVKEFAEGDNIPEGSRYPTYVTSPAYKNYGLSVSVTANQIADRDFEAELDEMKDLSRSINYGVDLTGMQMFNGGFATTTTVNGYDMTWYGDGVPQFSTVHPTVVPGGSTQSNASSTGIPLNHDNYETGRLALNLQQTDNGLALAFAGKLQLITPLALEKKAKETIDSDLTPEDANNSINVFRGSTDIITSKFLDSGNGGSNTAWFLLNAGDHKLYHDTRQEKALNSDVDIKSKSVTYTIDARWMNYSKEWKATWASPGNSSSYSS